MFRFFASRPFSRPLATLTNNLTSKKFVTRTLITTMANVTTPYSLLKDIELKGFEPDAEPFKARDLWASKPVLVFVTRRPGCQFCREEANELASRRDLIQNKLGVDMISVIHEKLGQEEFNEKFWKGTMYWDNEKGFYSALGGGQLRMGGLTTFLKPSVWMNYARNKKRNVEGNMKGEGRILGGLYIMAPGDTGAVYEYREKVFGDYAPIDDVLRACQKLSNTVDEEVGRLVDEEVNRIVAEREGRDPNAEAPVCAMPNKTEGQQAEGKASDASEDKSRL